MAMNNKEAQIMEEVDRLTDEILDFTIRLFA